MLFDARTTLADAAASGASATAQLGNSLDISATGVDGNVDDNVGGVRDIGAGQPLFLNVFAVEDYVGTSNSDNIILKFVSSDNAGLTSYVTHFTLPTFVYGLGTDVLDAGDVAYQGVIPNEGGVPYKRYVGLIEIVAGATTTGKITAFLSLDPNNYKYYPQADVNL